MNSAPPRRLGYVPRLDGLRAVAVTMVLVSHAFVRADGAGPVGVGIFFVLSGFLITTILDDEYVREGRLSLRRFYARRVLRLYPALCSFVVVFVAGIPLGVWRTHSLSDGLRGAALALTYTTDLFTIVGHGRIVVFELLLTWTLSVEEQFYILWPTVYGVLMRRLSSWRARLSWIAGAIGVEMVVRFIASSRAGIALTPLTWADSLLIGCVFGLAFRQRWIRTRNLHPLVFGLALLPALRILVWGLRPGFDYAVGLTFFDLGIGLWVLRIVEPVRSVDILGSRPAAWVGRISYGVYLWHSLIFVALREHLHQNDVTFFIEAYPASLLVAALSYRVIETPFLRVKRRLSSTPGNGESLRLQDESHRERDET